MTTALVPIDLLNDQADSLKLAEPTITEIGPAADAVPAKVLLEDVDPSELIFTRNVRKAELTPDFVGSIKENGLYQPIIATPMRMGSRSSLATDERRARSRPVGPLT